MSNSYVLLEKIVVPAAGASSVTFANIPQTGYTDLVIKYSARVDASGNYQSMAMAFNGGSPASAFTQRWINGNGVSAASGSYGANTTLYPSYVNAASSTSSTFGNGEIYIPNYSSTSQYKSVSVDAITETNATDARSELDAMLWSSNNAVTSITLYGNTNFVANSTFYLYGVAALGTTPTIAPKATGGDVVMTDGTYWYHAFRASGTFTPAVGLSCDVLVVAGGGAGGAGGGAGGGGAGGFRVVNQSVATSTSYTVTIGAGGATNAGGIPGGSGVNSSFIGTAVSISSTGGGGGGTSGGNGANGGSGGGAGHAPASGGTGNAGSYSPSEGSDGGGAGAASGFYAAGGGGGVSAVGTAGNSAVGGGNGGVGTNTYSSWASATSTGVSGYYAGGGGGGVFGAGTLGTGGAGGGGASNVAGTTNTGGGGGGGSLSPSRPPGAGGSGLVIVRYLVA